MNKKQTTRGFRKPPDDKTANNCYDYKIYMSGGGPLEDDDDSGSENTSKNDRENDAMWTRILKVPYHTASHSDSLTSYYYKKRVSINGLMRFSKESKNVLEI